MSAVTHLVTLLDDLADVRRVLAQRLGAGDGPAAASEAVLAGWEISGDAQAALVRRGLAAEAAEILASYRSGSNRSELTTEGMRVLSSLLSPQGQPVWRQALARPYDTDDGQKALIDFTLTDCEKLVARLRRQMGGLASRAKVIDRGRALLVEHGAAAIGRLPKSVQEEYGLLVERTWTA